jgi:hypothetical protein
MQPTAEAASVRVPETGAEVSVVEPGQTSVPVAVGEQSGPGDAQDPELEVACHAENGGLPRRDLDDPADYMIPLLRVRRLLQNKVNLTLHVFDVHLPVVVQHALHDGTVLATEVKELRQQLLGHDSERAEWQAERARLIPELEVVKERLAALEAEKVQLAADLSQARAAKAQADVQAKSARDVTAGTLVSLEKTLRDMEIRVLPMGDVAPTYFVPRAMELLGALGDFRDALSGHVTRQVKKGAEEAVAQALAVLKASHPDLDVGTLEGDSPGETAGSTTIWSRPWLELPRSLSPTLTLALLLRNLFCLTCKKTCCF